MESEYDRLDKAEIKLEELKKICEEKGYKEGWIFYQLKEEFGEYVAETIFPKVTYTPPNRYVYLCNKKSNNYQGGDNLEDLFMFEPH